VSVVANLALELRYLVRGVAAAMLPAPENRRAGVAWGVDVALYSMAVGLVEAVGGGLSFFFGAIAFMMGSVPIFNTILLENWFPALSSTHIRGGGLVALLVWCTHPLAWFFILEGVTGVVRIVAFATSREPVGEPVVWLVLRLDSLIGRGLRRERVARTFGPLREDRLVWRPRGGLEIMTCRERPDWEEGTTLQVQDRFFRLGRAEERAEGAFHVMVHHLQELEEHEVIRHPVPYEDTVAAVAKKRPGTGRQPS
jgi:hypothetical protein